MKFFKKVFYKLGSFFIDYERLAGHIAGSLDGNRLRQISDLERQIQVLFTEMNRVTNHLRLGKLKFEEIQFRVFSQNGEDGILRYLFDCIGAPHRRAVEICAGDGKENNTANLIVHHGWSALLVDGDENKVKTGQRFYRENPATALFPPTFVHAWVTPQNVDALIRHNGFTGEIDLLSIDLDGVDYWIWESIECINPRVVVVEYNQVWPAEKSVTVPNDPNFRAEFFGNCSDYAGASLAAMVALGKRLGYRLVGVEAKQFNAFFLRNDIGQELFPEIPVSAGLNSEFVEKTRGARLRNIESKPWVNV